MPLELMKKESSKKVPELRKSIVSKDEPRPASKIVKHSKNTSMSVVTQRARTNSSTLSKLPKK